MKTKSAVMLRILLNKFHEGPTEALLSCLPQEDIQKVLDQTVESRDVSKAFVEPLERIRQIHYSWLLPVMQHLPKGLDSFVLASLPKEQAIKLSRQLKVTPFEGKLSSTMKNFLLQTLYSKTDKAELLPIDFLPQTRLTDISYLNKEQLIKLIDFLGLYDLAEEIRHIVDKKILDGFYHCITKKQEQFLNVCLQKKEKLATPRLGLQTWKGDCDQLKKMLHFRGMGRLGHALCREHPALLWHITHTLDTGCGRIIYKCYNEETSREVASVLAQEVVNVIKFLKLKRLS